MKIFVTGGHVTPAIAVIEEIQKTNPNWEIVFVGRKYAMEGEREVSAEFRVVSGYGIRFIPITTGRLQRSFTRHTIPSILKIIVGCISAFWCLMRERPSAIVSFGGYIAFPIVFVGWILKIPSLTHEQTTTVGLSNRMMIPFVQKICISFPESTYGKSLLKEKTVFTGLPIREGLFALHPKPLFPLSTEYPLLYIAGGATGSSFINEFIFSILPDLTKRYTIIHQTGYSSYNSAKEKSLSLPSDQKLRYHPFAYLDISDLAWGYQHAKLYIGRSGGNTTGELAILGNVALFIPLPWAADDEQQKNARMLERAGSAVVLQQKDVTPAQFMDAMNNIFSQYQAYLKAARAFAKTIPQDGASRIASEIQKLLS